MITKRKKNERDFENWKDIENAHRIYWFEIEGKSGWKARYLKEVDKDELTIRFWQEIYDDKGVLKEIHQKYPVDKGHKKI